MNATGNYSPLRYPGGKMKLSGYVQKLIYENKLNKSLYVEPFAGGAGVALNLLINKHVSGIIINDFDRSIYAFWYSVLNHTDDLCDMIQDTSVDMEQWYLQKEIQKNKDNEPLLRLGFSTFFLNRTNRSGIIKAGVIGGYNQNGIYKMDCRFNKDDLISRIRKIATYKDYIQLYNMDTLDLIENVISNIHEPSFIFFDPPYYNKGSKLYVNYYKHNDHLELSNTIAEIRDHYWIVTYDYESQISNMYDEFQQITYGLKYTAAKKYTGYEIMIYSNNLKLPDGYENII